MGAEQRSEIPDLIFPLRRKVRQRNDESRQRPWIREAADRRYGFSQSDVVCDQKISVVQVDLGFSGLIRTGRQRQVESPGLVRRIDNALQPQDRIAMLPRSGAQRIGGFLIESVRIPLAKPL